MKRNLARKLFSTFFLSVFFIKMLICITPFIASNFDSSFMNAVIMQLEIEDNAEKFPEKIKESLLKEYCNYHCEFRLSNPLLFLASTAATVEDYSHTQTYFPSVPTQPPSA